MTLNHPKPSSSGYGLILVLLILAVVAIMASALVPDLVRQTMARHHDYESERLPRLARGYVQSIHRTHTIPGLTNWIPAIARETGLNTSEVAQVYSAFPTDANTRRVFLIHPNFTPGYGSDRLPFIQQPEGITQGDTNAPTADSRVMILSNIRRELSLPLSSGVPSSAAFEAVWDWVYDPATRAPPSGWPTAWNNHGDALQVARLNLANQFHLLTLKGLNYSLDDSSSLEQIGALTQRHFLRSSLMEIDRQNGTRYTSYIINKDAVFDLPNGPLLYYRLNETSGSTATNYGTFGTGANGTYTGGPVLAQNGPRPPTFPGYPTNNYAVKFDGNNDYVDSSQQLPTAISSFTLAGWINPHKNMVSNGALFGQKEVLEFESKNNNSIRINVHDGGFLDANYPHPNNEWHHVAATGDGTTTRIYIDGVLVGSEPDSLSNYGNAASIHPFRIAGLISKNNGNDYNKIFADEVVFYSMALSDAEILDLFNGTVPFFEEPEF